MSAQIDVRPSPIAGRWYPANAQVLAHQVDEYINAAQVAPEQDAVVAVIAPHAGHIYSGPVAGYAFAALRGLRPSLVCVVSPMHHYYPQALLTTAHQAYATPLGNIMVDAHAQEDLNTRLKQKLGFGLSFIKHDPEHSLEIELPFLQRIFPEGFQLLPVMLRDQSPQVAQTLGHALAEILTGQNAVLVASTDLSHFYTQQEAKELDSVMLEQMEAFNPTGVIQAEQDGRGFACGHGAVAAVLWAAKDLGADQVKVLRYATSGDVSGDYEQVVGYSAAVVTRTRSG